MASMIDVVFLLLIFFMCTSSFSTPEQLMPTQLPSVSPQARQAADFDPIRIRLAGGPGWVTMTIDGQAVTDLDALERQLAAREAVADVPVIITGETAVPFDRMVGAFDRCRKVGLERVAFSAGGD